RDRRAECPEQGHASISDVRPVRSAISNDRGGKARSMHHGAARLHAIILRRANRSGAREQRRLTACLPLNYKRTVRALQAMAVDATGSRYSGAAIALHWLTAVLIVAN